MVNQRIDPQRGIVYSARGSRASKKCGGGYMQVWYRRKLLMVHRVIWAHVHGAIPRELQINHINGVKDDNRIANLELVTRRENMVHAYATQLLSAVGSKNGRAKLTTEQVREVRSSALGSSAIARELGMSRKAISDIRNYDTWRHV